MSGLECGAISSVSYRPLGYRGSGQMHNELIRYFECHTFDYYRVVCSSGQVLNINADVAARELAVALKPMKVPC